VYFTSGTQHGNPIDRLLGSIGRRFGASAGVMAPSGPGKAYFVETLLKDVMIGESGLAGINRRLEARKAAAQLGAYAAVGLVAASGVAVLSVSYNRNREFLEQIAPDITAYDEVARTSRADSLAEIVPRLDAVRAIVETADRYRANTTWVMSWGLYQGASIGNAAQNAYLHELDGMLLPRVAAQIRARMIQYASEPEKLYLYLKGYLMLGEPKHMDKAHLKLLTDLEWEAAPSGVGPALSKHFQSLLDSSDRLRPLPLDSTLVNQARSSIRQTSMSKIMYDGVKRAYTAENAAGLRVNELAGLEVEKVFKRRSGVPLSSPIPKLYTKEAFKEITGGGRVELLAQMNKDAWVWGENAATSLANARSLVSGVTNLYEQDYIREWDALLGDLQFASFQSVPQLNDALRILTAPSSPLRGILHVVDDNTALVETKSPSAATGVIDQTTKRFSDTLSGVLKPLKGVIDQPSGAPGMLVTAHFQWVRQLTAGEAGKTQLDAIIATLSEIQRQVGALGPDAAGGNSREILSSPSFRALMQTLRQQADVLPSGLRTLVSQIVEASDDSVRTEATGQIEQMYGQQVVPTCRDRIANRYPFANVGQPDVQLADFGAVFGYEGLFDKFFSTNLEKLVDTSQSQWTWRPGSVNPTHRLLEQFQAARRLRDMFFPPGSKTPKLEFGVTIRDLDSNSTRFVLELDGQILDEKHQAPVTKLAVWPGPTPGRAAGTFEGNFYENPKQYGGPWAWFRMIDALADGPGDAQQRIRLIVQNRYHRVNLTVQAARAGDNPFATREWRQFSCES
jgi:type VI secretion system protein ImpL